MKFSIAGFFQAPSDLHALRLDSLSPPPLISYSPVQRKSPCTTVAVQTDLENFDKSPKFRKRTNTCPEKMSESNISRRSRTTQSYDRDIKSSWSHSNTPTRQTSLEDFKELLRERDEVPNSFRNALYNRFSVIQEETQDNELDRHNMTQGVSGTLV